MIRLRPLISDEILEKFSRQDVTAVHRTMGQREVMTHNVRPTRQGMELCGRALTVKRHAGNDLVLIKAVSMAQEDNVIVAGTSPLADNGPFGEVFGVDCQSHGVSGLVMTCGMRDVEVLNSMDFSIFSKEVNVFETSRAVKGIIDHLVAVGGVLVHPGDAILEDWDGIAVTPCKEAAEVLRLADTCREKEKGIMERLHRGESLFDTYGYQETLQALGVAKGQGELMMTDIVVERVRKLDTTGVSGAMDKLGIKYRGYHIKPISTGPKIYGRAFTAHYVPCGVVQGTVGDFLNDVQSGQVVVTGNGGRDNCTARGDITAKTAKFRGIGGTVIDGAYRDIPVTLECEYPVFLKGYYMRTGRDWVQVDAVNTPMQLSDTPVYPSDIILNDDVGVVAIPWDMAEEAARIAEETEEKEQSIFKLVS